MKLTCMVLVSRALKAVRRLDFFGLAVCKTLEMLVGKDFSFVGASCIQTHSIGAAR